MNGAPNGGRAGSPWSIGIDNQGGVIHNVNLYQRAPGDRPNDDLRRGIDLLVAGLPRQAAKSFVAAYEGGLRSNALWFYWTLAILSGRTEIDIAVDEYDQVVNCLDLTDHERPDRWSDGMRAVQRLLDLTFESRDSGLDQSALEEVLHRIRGLDPEIRSAVRRHLDVIVNGRITHALWEEYRAEVARIRTSGDREDRAWKFFIPDQAPPRPPGPDPYRPRGREVSFAAAGLVIAVAVSWTMLVQLPDLIAGFMLLAAVVSAVPAFYCGMRLASNARRVSDLRLELRGMVYDPRQPILGEYPFNKEFMGLLDEAFRRYPPPDFALEWWMTETEAFRRTVSLSVTESYLGHATPARLRWLAEHIARTQAAHATRPAGRLLDPRFGVPFEFGAVWGLVCAIVLYTAAMVFTSVLVDASVSVETVVLGLFLGSALMFAIPDGARLAAGPGGARERRQRRDGEFRQAAQTYQYWTDRLADRPGDREMADWLAADLSWIRLEAMDRLRLPYADVIAHFSISEGTEGAQAARVRFGPVRYSFYNLRVFLLTENGVRVYKVTLDFADGTYFYATTDNFRYDMIVSAGVVEMGPRRGGLQPGAQGGHVHPPVHALRLQLHGREINIVVGDDRGRTLVDGAGEDSGALLRLELESSGAEHGLRILQSVAGEGKGWIETERARQREFFRQERPGRKGLGTGPAGRVLELEGPEVLDPGQETASNP